MKSICGKAAAITCLALFGVTFMASVNAQVVVLTDLSNFSGNEELIDFENLGSQNDPVPSVNSVSFALSASGFPPRFSNQDIGTRPFGPQGVGSIDPALIGAPFSPYDDLDITFPDPVNRVGFVISANDANTVDVTTLNSGTVIDQISFVTVAGFNFFGFHRYTPSDFTASANSE